MWPRTSTSHGRVGLDPDRGFGVADVAQQRSETPVLACAHSVPAMRAANISRSPPILEILRVPRVGVLIAAVLIGRSPVRDQRAGRPPLRTGGHGLVRRCRARVGGPRPGQRNSVPRYRGDLSTAGGRACSFCWAACRAGRWSRSWHSGAANASGRGPDGSGASSRVSRSRRPVPSCALAWPRLLGDRDDLVPAAYAFDSVQIEVAFITGPLLTAAGIALLGSGGDAGDLGRPQPRRCPPLRRLSCRRLLPMPGMTNRAGCLAPCRVRASGRWRSPRCRSASASARSRSGCRRSAPPTARPRRRACCSPCGRRGARSVASPTGRGRGGGR